jgi:hypothetical protein
MPHLKMTTKSEAGSVLGSARASRAGDGAFAIANLFSPSADIKPFGKSLFRRGAETGTRWRVRSPDPSIRDGH